MKPAQSLFLINGAEDAQIEARAQQIAEQHELGHEADFASFRVDTPDMQVPDEASFALTDLSATCDPPELRADELEQSPFWLRPIKRALHQLVLYYVNKSATQQAAFNVSALRAVSLLVKRLNASEAEVRLLRREVELLRSGDASHRDHQ